MQGIPKDIMQLVEQHIVKKTSPMYRSIDDMAFRSKNLYNATLYAVRQHFFKTEQYINYYNLQKQFQNERQPDYVNLPAKLSQWVMKMVDYNFKSFFNANKAYKQCPTAFTGKPKIPGYLDKEKGRYILTFTNQAVSKKSLDKEGILRMSGLEGVCIRTELRYEDINQVRIVKRNDAYVAEVVYSVPDVEASEDNGKYAAIDFGVNNLMAVTFNDARPFIVNGRPLKSINQYYNKTLARLKSHQKNDNRQINSRKIRTLTNKRNNKVKDYMHKASRMVVNHLVSNQVNTLVIGKTKGWKQDINNGSQNNQNFVQIPFSTLTEMLAYKCAMAGINVILQEESYTSKASFLDGDPIPVYKKGDGAKHLFSGRRVGRGLYETKDGRRVNADVNGSLNIMRKAVPNVSFTDGIEACSAPAVCNIAK